MRPDAVWNWWTQEVALELQQFYDDFAAGKRPKLVLMAPPQHGKSTTVEDFIAWVAGRNPNLKTIYASYSEQLGVTCNLNLQRMFTSQRYRFVFGNTRVGMPGWVCKNDFIEFEGNAGSFRNTTVNGQITGMELHLGVLDDPLKGRAEASSPLVRDRTWSWFVDDFCTRFAASSATLMILTRWHVDDPAGRFIERFPDVRVLHYPAIAEVDEKYRMVGEALFPQHKPRDFAGAEEVDDFGVMGIRNISKTRSSRAAASFQSRSSPACRCSIARRSSSRSVTGTRQVPRAATALTPRVC